MDFEQARFNMIEQQIRPWDVLDYNVLNTIEETPRELFVPEAHKKLAFSDLEIPLNFGQYMMAPKVEARMLQALDIHPEDSILEIGTGSGFVTACLSKLGNNVDSIEFHETFLAQAESALKTINISNVKLHHADILNNYSTQQQYNAIAVTASSPHALPSLYELLKPGGRLFLVIGHAPAMTAMLFTKMDDNNIKQISLFETCLQALIGIETTQEFTL